MKRIIYYSTLPLLLLMGLIGPDSLPTPLQSDEALEAQLQGAWNLVLRDGSTMEELDLQMVKIIQDGYFMFAFYQETSQSFYSAGGGTYEVTNGKYSEDIRFHTIDPELVGHHLDFNLRLENGHWYHEGKVSGNPLREVFERVDADATQAPNGAWTCLAHSEENGALREVRERDPQTWKLVTDRFFQWVTFDPRSGALVGCSGGTYVWEEGMYKENVAFHQQDSILTGHQLVWPSQLQEDTWTQTTPLSRGTEDLQRQIWQRMTP